MIKALSCLGVASMMALAGCNSAYPDPNTPDTFQSESDVRVGPTPTNGITTPGNPDSSADLGAGAHPVVPAPPPSATVAPPPRAPAPPPPSVPYDAPDSP